MGGEGVRKDFKSIFSRSSHGKEEEHCHARAEHGESVFHASLLRFPGVAASIRLHYMHRLSCDLAQDNQS